MVQKMRECLRFAYIQMQHRSPEKKAMLSEKLEAWLEQVKKDATALTPRQ